MPDPIFRSPFTTSAPNLTAYQRRQRDYERRRRERVQEPEAREAAERVAMREEIRRLRAEAECREQVCRQYDRKRARPEDERDRTIPRQGSHTTASPMRTPLRRRSRDPRRSQESVNDRVCLEVNDIRSNISTNQRGSPKCFS
jgi:hypothetical protein